VQEINKKQAFDFIEWFVHNCRKKHDGWVYNYSMAIEPEKTVEEMYDWWFENINK